MSTIELNLSDAHRRWIGTVTQHMRDVIEDLRRSGVAKGHLTALKSALTDLEDTTRAAQTPRPFLVEALLNRLWVDACELDAAGLENYGALGESERRFFDEQASALERCITRLREAIDAPTL